MKKINRLLTNICSSNLPASKAFYTKLFDFNVDYDSDWFVHLISNDQQLELGIIDRNSEIVPAEAQVTPAGFYLTFVVDNADEIHTIAQAENFTVLAEPEDTFYGQRRLLLKDPDGAIVDVSSPIANFTP
jgi:predicted enzyme related to lactoylglutathione lyase